MAVKPGGLRSVATVFQTLEVDPVDLVYPVKNFPNIGKIRVYLCPFAVKVPGSGK
jgi:hypothetical protein